MNRDQKKKNDDSHYEVVAKKTCETLLREGMDLGNTNKEDFPYVAGLEMK